MLEREKTLIIAEKRDAARRIVAALSSSYTSINFLGLEIYRFVQNSSEFTIIPAKGHLFGITATTKRRDAFPILDLEWMPLNTIDKKRTDIEKTIKAITELFKGVNRVIIACDYDVEGETIGYNIVKYCANSYINVQRAKFSTLTMEELRLSFQNLIPRSDWEMAMAGRARHYIDFLWGVNVSRLLTEELRRVVGGYNILSIGRVQGPTLKAIYEKELVINTFVSLPYWEATALAESEGNTFKIYHPKILIKEEALKLSSLRGTTGVISQIIRNIQSIPPPPPFNLQELQIDAYRYLGYSPWKTLAVAETLYLKAFISYPRTSSQLLPPNINTARIFERLGSQYADIKQNIKRKKAIAGKGSDPAHPAIYPTGEGKQESYLTPEERRLYDLIVRRFLAAFMEEARVMVTKVTLRFGEEQFITEGRKTLSKGWLFSYYFRTNKDKDIPELRENQEVYLKEIDIKKKYEESPARFNQSSLIDWMDQHGLGTKATRADIIKTLYERNYISGKKILLTDLGYSVIGYLDKTIPSIMTIGLTTELEKKLEAIENSQEIDSRVIIDSMKLLVRTLEMTPDPTLASELAQGYMEFKNAVNTLADCPICKKGKLIIIRSYRTKKRFVGCTNYKGGCRASAPLPARGVLVNPHKKCPLCGWPIMQLRINRRRPWSFCINVKCPSKNKLAERTTDNPVRSEES